MHDIDIYNAPGLVVIGGGPAGLMAAEAAHAAGVEVDLYEAKGSVGRKFLIAGKGGLNLTHAEPRPGFDTRYRERTRDVGAWLDGFLVIFAESGRQTDGPGEIVAQQFE